MSNRNRLFTLFILLAQLLASCSAPTPAPTATATPEPSATPSPIRPTEVFPPTPPPTPAPSSTPTVPPPPTAAPTSELFSLPGTPLPADLSILTYRNAGDVSGLAEFNQDTVTDLVWTPDGGAIAAAAEDAFTLYDALLLQPLQTVSTDPGLVGLAFSLNGSYLATANRFGNEEDGYGGSVEFWKVQDWEPLGTFIGMPLAISNIAYSPDGRNFAAGFTSSRYTDNQVIFWDTLTWEITQTLKTGTLQEMAFSPTGEILATTPDRYAIKVWSVKDGDLLFNLRTSFTGAVNSIAFSPDGTVIATGHYDGTIRLWSTDKGQLLNEFNNGGVVESLAFSPNGELLAAGDSYQDYAVRLWDAETGELLRVLPGHQHGVEKLAFSPDGSLLASSSYDGSIRLWGIRP